MGDCENFCKKSCKKKVIIGLLVVSIILLIFCIKHYYPNHCSQGTDCDGYCVKDVFQQCFFQKNSCTYCSNGFGNDCRTYEICQNDWGLLPLIIVVIVIIILIGILICKYNKHKSHNKMTIDCQQDPVFDIPPQQINSFQQPPQTYPNNQQYYAGGYQMQMQQFQQNANIQNQQYNNFNYQSDQQYNPNNATYNYPPIESMG